MRNLQLVCLYQYLVYNLLCYLFIPKYYSKIDMISRVKYSSMDIGAILHLCNFIHNINNSFSYS